MADLKGCPFGQDIKNDCKTCDYGDTNHFDAASGKCVKRWFHSSKIQGHHCKTMHYLLLCYNRLLGILLQNIHLTFSVIDSAIGEPKLLNTEFISLQI